MKDNKKTPEYTRRAIEKYRAGKYNISVMLPLEYKEIIKREEETANSYINRLVREDLTRRGLLRTGETETAAADAPSATDDAPRTFRAPF